MRDKLGALAFAAVLAAATAGSAGAMSSAEHPRPACRVVGGEKLPAESGGADALCRAITAAVSARVPGVQYNVEVRVLPRSRLAAALTTADGRGLPPQNFASMDKPLTNKSFQRFAKAIAAALAKAQESNP